MNLGKALAQALADPALASALSQFAGRLIEARKEQNRLHWGTASDGAPVIEDPKGQVLPVLGALAGVAYVAEKGTDGLSVYEHAFDLPLPWLCVTEAGELTIQRGESRYRVRTAGITG